MWYSSVPAIFKLVAHALVTAIFTSYKEPLGAQEWGRRYTDLISQSPIDPVPLHLPHHLAARGVYAHNNILQNLTKLGEGLLLLPEDLVVDPTGSFLYVTNQDGWIKKYHFSNARVENWTYVGGRPLGIALDNAGNVIVCEPGQGQLIQIGKETGDKKILTTEAEGVKFDLIDEAIVASDGLIYFTDASSKYNLNIWWRFSASTVVIKHCNRQSINVKALRKQTNKQTLILLMFVNVKITLQFSGFI